MITKIHNNIGSDEEYWGLQWLVTLPFMGPKVSHARATWCDQYVGDRGDGTWNYWDYNTQYRFRTHTDAVTFMLTWS